MNENFIELNGEEKGATSVVLVGVHGDEKCGIDATPVGIVTNLPGVTVLQSNGIPFDLKTTGFNHFI